MIIQGSTSRFSSRSKGKGKGIYLVNSIYNHPIRLLCAARAPFIEAALPSEKQRGQSEAHVDTGSEGKPGGLVHC